MEQAPLLADVRRLEAVSFRAWPAASVHFDGAWQIRLTAGHPSRRLNSVNPLDPSDDANVVRRVAAACRRFDAYDRPAVFRLTPLAPSALVEHLDRENWTARDETIVMGVDLAHLALKDARDLLPVRDIGRYVDASLAVHQRAPTLKAGLTEVLHAVRPELGLFVMADEAQRPVATIMSVHDNDLVGLFELCVRPDRRGAGLGRTITAAALRWARLRGAQRAWLQVEAANVPALSLYRSFGFDEIYSYLYRIRENLDAA